jgi:hypothetical protein
VSEGAPVPDHLLHRSIRIRVVRDVFEIVAFAAAGIWAIWTFWYQASYAPKHEKPAVDWKLSLELVGRRPTGELAVRATVKAKNTGKAVERLAAIVVNVTGVRVEPDTTADPFATIEPSAEGWHAQIASRESAHVLLASEGDRFGDGTDVLIQPEEDWLWETTFLVPAGDYALLRGHMRETSILGNAPIKLAWFREDHDEVGPFVVATDACRASRDCQVASANDSTELSLWPAPSPPASQ